MQGLETCDFLCGILRDIGFNMETGVLGSRDDHPRYLGQAQMIMVGDL